MWKTNYNDGEDQDTGRVAPKCLQYTSCEKYLKNNGEFSVDNWKETELDFFWLERVPLPNWAGETPFS